MSHDKETEHAVKTALNVQRDALDPVSLSRLRQARRAAIETAGSRTSLRERLLGARWAIPVGAFASVAVVALAVTVALRTPQPADTPVEPGDAVEPWIEMAEADVDVELLEDLEFYRWLDLSGDDGGPA